MTSSTFNGYVTGSDGAVTKNFNGAAAATISILFVVCAIVFGLIEKAAGNRMKEWHRFVLAIALIVFMFAAGMKMPAYLTAHQWNLVIMVYLFIAAVMPMWILMQPRDYMTTFMLLGMILGGVLGVIVGHPTMKLNAFNGFVLTSSTGAKSYMFPTLFVTIACGAVSGFHSLVSSGTTSKQLDKESDAKPIAYGGMLLECVLAIITVCAIAYARTTGHTKGATDIFAGGIAAMVAAIPGLEGMENSFYTLLVLTYSAFCLTSLDTATRLARFMFQEFWLEPGETVHDVKDGFRKFMVNPYFATILTVVLGVLLGLNGFAKIWGLFGAANQLLAGIGLLAVATWLGNAGKNNKMFLFPMTFMLIVTICSLILTIKNQLGIIAKGAAHWGPYAQAGIGTLLVLLAFVLAIEGYQTIAHPKEIAKR